MSIPLALIHISKTLGAAYTEEAIKERSKGVYVAKTKTLREDKKIRLVNPSSSDEGIHSASMGNVWQCAVCGFAGLRWAGEQLVLENHLPAS